MKSALRPIAGGALIVALLVLASLHPAAGATALLALLSVPA